ncbi:hypothetical protein Tco_0053428 [Tanacetum coccineum]
MRIEESLNVTFDESLPEPKSSSLVEDDRIDEPIVQALNGSTSLQVNVLDEGYPKSLKEARCHPIEQVIGELNERTLRFLEDTQQAEGRQEKKETLSKHTKQLLVVKENSFEIEFDMLYSKNTFEGNALDPMDPCLGTRGSNDLGARKERKALLLYESGKTRNTEAKSNSIHGKVKTMICFTYNAKHLACLHQDD